MAEILLEGRDCEACGTEIRKSALFCYHCGASVAPDVVVTTDLDEKVSDAGYREEVAAPVEESLETTDETEIIEESGEVEPVDEADETELVEDADAEAVEDSSGETEIAEDEAVINKDGEAETADEEKAIEKEAEEEADEKPKLKTAAAMRRKPKRIQKKRVEIVWEEPVSPPNIWFLIATVLFAALAIGLWFVAKYLG